MMEVQLVQYGRNTTVSDQLCHQDISIENIEARPASHRICLPAFIIQIRVPPNDRKVIRVIEPRLKA